MVNKYKKKCSTPLAIKETQIEMIMRFYIIQVTSPVIEKTNRNKCWQGCWGTGEKGEDPYTLLVGM
jgi:predicted metal-binding protein